MAPLIGMPSGMEWLIILAIALLLFGGSRLAGLGKSTGKAIKEFKEETKGISPGDKDDPDTSKDNRATKVESDEVSEAEIVSDPPPRNTER